MTARFMMASPLYVAGLVRGTTWGVVVRHRFGSSVRPVWWSRMPMACWDTSKTVASDCSVWWPLAQARLRPGRG